MTLHVTAAISQGRAAENEAPLRHKEAAVVGLLDGDIAALFSSALSGLYLDAVLHRKDPNDGDDGAGGGPDQTFLPDEAVKAQLDSVVERTIDGVPDRYQRILVLAHGVSAPTVDDEISVGDVRWKIAEVGQDAAKSYYDLAGRESSLEVS